MIISLEGILINVSVFLFSLFTVILILIRHRYNYWKNIGVPFIPPSIPYGNAYALFKRKISYGQLHANIYQYMKNKGYRYGGAYFFTTATFIPVDVEIVKNVLNRDFAHFTDRGIYCNEKGDPLTAHLFSLPLKQWKSLRVKLTPTFTSGKLKGMFQTLIDCGQELNTILDKASSGTEPVDVKDIVGRYTTDVIGSCAFGIDCNSLKDPNTDFRKYGKRVFEYNSREQFKNFLEFCFPELMLFFNATMFPAEATAFFMGVVRDTINHRERNNVKRKDFLNLLIKLKNTDNMEKDARGATKIGEHDDDATEEDNVENVKLTFEQIAAQCFVFFLGGFETSSTTLMFCLFELANNEKIQSKLREEILTTLEKHGGNVTYDSIMDMHYMENVINETLRKYPPLSVLNRICTKDYDLPETGLRISKGMHVVIPILGIHHDPEHYPEPEKFDPDRFTEENKQNRHPFAFIPFGEGPRMCIGIRFGMMQTKVGLTLLLRKYHYSLSEKTALPLQFTVDTFMTNVVNGMWLRIKKL